MSSAFRLTPFVCARLRVALALCLGSWLCAATPAQDSQVKPAKAGAKAQGKSPQSSKPAKSGARKPAAPAVAVVPADPDAPVVAPLEAPEPRIVVTVPESEVFQSRPVAGWAEAQIVLSRLGFSCGSIDGIGGAQTVAALRAFQRVAGLRESGALDESTASALTLESEPFGVVIVRQQDLDALQPIGKTWLEKSEQSALAHETILEAVAEASHAHPAFVKRLNPGFDWEHVAAGARIKVPSVEVRAYETQAVRLQVRLSERVLEALDAQGTIMAHFPVSIAKRVEKRPQGELHVKVVIRNPDYTVDPAVMAESEEMQRLGRKLILQPGPNNPVGVAWIGLDLAGYGIHGTPTPEHVGRTESHGCFRLANWDARTLLDLVQEGTLVEVLP